MGNAGIMWIVYEYKRAGRRARLRYMLARFAFAFLFRWELPAFLLVIVRWNLTPVLSSMGLQAFLFLIPFTDLLSNEMSTV
jgi:hypothetical protein